MMQQMTGARAPSAGAPGRGLGNVPYAKGMVSGQFGSISPQARPPAMDEPMPGMGSAPAPPSPGPAGGDAPPAPVPPGPGQANPYLDPMFYFDVMAAIMAALTSAADSDTGFY